MKEISFDKNSKNLNLDITSNYLLDRFANILQLLMDCQNGVPLYKDENEWKNAMEQGMSVIKEYEKITGKIIFNYGDCHKISNFNKSQIKSLYDNEDILICTIYNDPIYGNRSFNICNNCEYYIITKDDKEAQPYSEFQVGQKILIVN